MDGGFLLCIIIVVSLNNNPICLLLQLLNSTTKSIATPSILNNVHQRHTTNQKNFFITLIDLLFLLIVIIIIYVSLLLLKKYQLWKNLCSIAYNSHVVEYTREVLTFSDFQKHLLGRTNSDKTAQYKKQHKTIKLNTETWKLSIIWMRGMMRIAICSTHRYATS